MTTLKERDERTVECVGCLGKDMREMRKQIEHKSVVERR